MDVIYDLPVDPPNLGIFDGPLYLKWVKSTLADIYPCQLVTPAPLHAHSNESKRATRVLVGVSAGDNGSLCCYAQEG